MLCQAIAATDAGPTELPAMSQLAALRAVEAAAERASGATITASACPADDHLMPTLSKGRA